ncbi:MAG: imidazole glycerol phosphate synthase subunit HisH [Candidatus Omnitrophota bacterium]
MGKFIVVVDYGLGNLRSVAKALELAGAKVKVTNKLSEIDSSCAVVLPGVGAFKRAMENLNELDLTGALLQTIKTGKPFLGVCLGLQLLFTESEEHGLYRGLDVIRGKVKKIAPGVKVPHMGWNNIKIVGAGPCLCPKGAPARDKKSVGTDPDVRSQSLFTGIPDESYFYFVHSYYVEPRDKSVIEAVTEYGQEFVSAVHKDNVWGVQFHPEKSAELGLRVLRNFVSVCG